MQRAIFFLRLWGVWRQTPSLPLYTQEMHSVARFCACMRAWLDRSAGAVGQRSSQKKRAAISATSSRYCCRDSRSFLRRCLSTAGFLGSILFVSHVWNENMGGAGGSGVVLPIIALTPFIIDCDKGCNTRSANMSSRRHACPRF